MKAVPGLLVAALAASLSSKAAIAQTATIRFGNALKQVRFEREGSPVRLASYAVPISFHPGLRAKEFTARIRVRAQGSARPLSSTASCRWNAARDRADCRNPGGGGRYQLIAGRLGNGASRRRLALRIATSDGFTIGFNAAEPDASILVRPAGPAPALVPIQY